MKGLPTKEVWIYGVIRHDTLVCSCWNTCILWYSGSVITSPFLQNVFLHLAQFDVLQDYSCCLISLAGSFWTFKPVSFRCSTQKVSNSLMNQIIPKWIIRHYGFQSCIFFTTPCPWVSHKPHILRNRSYSELESVHRISVLKLECNVSIMKFAVIMAVNTVLNITVLKGTELCILLFSG